MARAGLVWLCLLGTGFLATVALGYKAERLNTAMCSYSEISNNKVRYDKCTESVLAKEMKKVNTSAGNLTEAEAEEISCELWEKMFQSCLGILRDCHGWEEMKLIVPEITSSITNLIGNKNQLDYNTCVKTYGSYDVNRGHKNINESSNIFFIIIGTIMLMKFWTF